MLDLETQSQLVDATAAMLRSCVTATTNTWAASACRGLSLWAEMLGGVQRLQLSRNEGFRRGPEIPQNLCVARAKRVLGRFSV